MSMHISEAMGLNVTSHSEIEFVDVVLSPDTKLFLDPCLIEFGKDDWTSNSQRTISSYFDKFYDLYRSGSANHQKLELFEHSHEINATKLGYGNGHNGKAKTAQGMVETFAQVPKLLQKGIKLSQPCDLSVFVRDFAEDCLSDMLTNIIFKELMDFTLDQCQKYNVSTCVAPRGHYYWNADTGSWVQYEGQCLMVGESLILMVPKNIVRNRYYFTAEQYFSRIILSKIQEDESWTDAKGKQQKPFKKQLRDKHKKNESVLDCVVRFTTENPLYLPEYHRKLPSLYVGQRMSDEELDELLY